MKLKVIGVLLALLLLNLGFFVYKYFQESRGPQTATKLAATVSQKKLPRIAIVIDDLGIKDPAYFDLKTIPYKLNLAIIPGLKDSKELAKELAQDERYELILHMPMSNLNAYENQESKNYTYRGKYPYLINEKISKRAISKTIDKSLDSMDGLGLFRGINNHYGSKITASANVILTVEKLAKKRNMYFLDSLTSAESVAYEVAKKNHIKALYNEIFLDNVDDPDYIIVQLSKAQKLAEKNGHVIAIGHYSSQHLISVLKEELPRIVSENFELVFASELLD